MLISIHARSKRSVDPAKGKFKKNIALFKLYVKEIPLVPPGGFFRENSIAKAATASIFNHKPLRQRQLGKNMRFKNTSSKSRTKGQNKGENRCHPPLKRCT